MSAKRIWAIVIAILLVAGIIGGCALMINSGTKAAEISVEEAQRFVNEAFDNMAVSKVTSYVAEHNNIVVENISYGDEKDILLQCSVQTLEVHDTLEPHYNEFLDAEPKKGNGTMYKSALDFKLEFEDELLAYVQEAPEKTVAGTIYLYDTKEGLVAYAEKDAVDMVFGGVETVCEEISQKTGYLDENGQKVTFESENVKKGFIQCLDVKKDTQKPDTSTFIGRAWNNLKDQFYTNFIMYDRWKTIFTGLWVTIKLTFFALLIGIAIGFLVAFVRCTHLKSNKPGPILSFLNGISQLYLTVTRGTPVVVQIMIIYFVIFMPWGVDKFLAAVVCFGLNSGAYVAEIVRGGIMSVDVGQTEAGRSLGFGYFPTMWHIVFPQAFKAVLPALANEFVVLLKETSIAFYIGLGDLMYAVNAIRAATYSPFMPLIVAAIIYLVMVLILSKLVGILERRLRNSER